MSQRGENRACSRADFFNCCMFLWGFGWGGGGVGGMLTFIGLAGLRDAMLLHVLFNLHNYVMLCYCTFSSSYTKTWCYATARSLQSTQLRDATLLHVFFNLHKDVMLRYCTFSSMYTMLRWLGWEGGGCNNVNVDTFLILAFVIGFSGGGWGGGGDVNVHWTCTLTWCYATARFLDKTSQTFLLLRFELFHTTSKTLLLLRFEILFL